MPLLDQEDANILMRGLRLSVAVALLAVVEVSVAAAVQDESLVNLQTLDQRIADVSWRIAAANEALCPRRMHAIGISIHDAAQYAPAYRQAAIDTFGFGDGLPAVLAVASGGPAAQAGMQPGDRIAVLDGQVISPTLPAAKAPEDYGSMDAVMTRLENLPDRPIPIEILRGTRRIALTLQPATVCRTRVEVVPSGKINADSNGTVVRIYGKLALWTRNDDELATVMAHEMAHNILGHNARIERERISTGLSAIFGRDGAKLREMERDADRYGLYLVASAGYDYHVGPDFWRKLTNSTGLGSIWATTHPTARDRAAFNQEVVSEIDRQKAAGLKPTP